MADRSHAAEARSTSTARTTGASAASSPPRCGARSMARISARPAGDRPRSRLEIAESARARPGRAAARRRLRLRRPVPGAGREHRLCRGRSRHRGGRHRPCPVRGRGARARGPCDVPGADCGGRLPFADGAVRRGALRRCDQPAAGPPRHAARNGRACCGRAGGCCSPTRWSSPGEISKPELDLRAGLGFYLFVPPGVNEAAIAAAGLTLLHVDDRSAATAEIAGALARRRAPARQRS